MNAEEKKHAAWDILIKLVLISFPFLTGICGWTFTQLWSHEGRITILETETKGVHKTLDRMDQKLTDIQQQLRAR